MHEYTLCIQQGGYFSETYEGRRILWMFRMGGRRDEVSSMKSAYSFSRLALVVCILDPLAESTFIRLASSCLELPPHYVLLVQLSLKFKHERSFKNYAIFLPYNWPGGYTKTLCPDCPRASDKICSSQMGRTGYAVTSMS